MAKKNALDFAKIGITEILKRAINVAKDNRKSEAGSQPTDYVLSEAELKTLVVYHGVLRHDFYWADDELPPTEVKETEGGGEVKPKAKRGPKPGAKKAKANVVAETPAETPVVPEVVAEVPVVS